MKGVIISVITSMMTDKSLKLQRKRWVSSLFEGSLWEANK